MGPPSNSIRSDRQEHLTNRAGFVSGISLQSRTLLPVHAAAGSPWHDPEGSPTARTRAGGMSDHLVAAIPRETLEAGIHVNVTSVHAGQDDGIRAGLKGFDKALLRPLDSAVRSATRFSRSNAACFNFFFALYPSSVMSWAWPRT